MGMFDLVDYKGPLPKGVFNKSRIRMAIEESPMQTKAFRLWTKPDYRDIVSQGDLLTVTVTKDGTLLDPDGKKMQFTGFAYIGNGRKNCDLVCHFRNGLMHNVEFE